MFLRSAHIRHYKSLDDVRVEFTQPITVIVGPNAVGKSNFVDALRFLAQFCNLEERYAQVNTDGSTVWQSPIVLRGGLQRVRQRGIGVKDRTQISVNIDVSTPDSIQETKITSTLPSTDGEDFSLQTEYIPPRPVWGSNPFDCSDLVKSWQFSSIFPNTLRQPSFSYRPNRLMEDGSNWASVARELKKTKAGKVALNNISETMRSIIPGFRDIKVRTVGNYLVPHFLFDDGGKSVEFDPLQLSDGTLRIFGLLLAIYQLPATTLLVIEEPEHTVYPGALGVLVDAMREVSEQTQIILTTHSPDLVHYFKPDEIRVATIENGHTRIAPICTPQRAAIDEHLMTAEDFMRAEGLQPEPAQKPAA